MGPTTTTPPRAFLDSNIFIYALTVDVKAKNEIAVNLLRSNPADHLVTGFQAVQEVANVFVRKYKVRSDVIEGYLDLEVWPRVAVMPSRQLTQDAFRIHDRYGFAFYDSMIVAAAIQANCQTLYTEGMQPGQVIGELKIVNPFQ